MSETNGYGSEPCVPAPIPLAIGVTTGLAAPRMQVMLPEVAGVAPVAVPAVERVTFDPAVPLEAISKTLEVRPVALTGKVLPSYVELPVPVMVTFSPAVNPLAAVKVTLVEVVC